MTREEALRYAVDTESFVSGRVLDHAPELVETHFPGRRVVLCADLNTWDAAGEAVWEMLRSAGIPVEDPYLWRTREPLEPDTSLVPELAGRIDPDRHALVAVGSGTINDLAKVAAFESDIRYMIVATAASVDGYTSPGGSMVVDGFKQSLYCRAPVAVLADTSVLAAAPKEMLSAGYADLASKIPAGVDWIIADEIGADPIDPVCWRMIQDDLLTWLAEPRRIAKAEGRALEEVMYGLTMTGIGMQYLRRSRPASGAEHLMSHIWEMRGHRHRGRPVSHGFQVAVGTLTMTAFVELLFDRTPDRRQPERRLRDYPSWETREREIRRVFGGFGSVSRIIEEARAKYLDGDEVEARLTRAVESWDRMRERVAERAVPYDTLRGWFSDAGCPTDAASIGLSREALFEALSSSVMMRNRYTALDLAWELGLLEDVSAELAEHPKYPV